VTETNYEVDVNDPDAVEKMRKLTNGNPSDDPKPGAPQEDSRKGLPESVKVEEASAPMQLEQPAPDWKGPWIRYNGVGTIRIMDPAAWRSAGVQSNKRYEWNYLNQKRIPRSLFTDEELQYLLRVDGRFSLVED
jgi:hypothetical protein